MFTAPGMNSLPGAALKSSQESSVTLQIVWSILHQWTPLTWLSLVHHMSQQVREWRCVRRFLRVCEKTRQEPCNLCSSITWVACGMSFRALPGVENRSEFTSDYPESYPLLFRISWLYNLNSCVLTLVTVWSLNSSGHCSVTLPDPQN